MAICGVMKINRNGIRLREWGCMIGDKHFKMDYTQFPEVTFENSPMEVELK